MKTFDINGASYDPNRVRVLATRLDNRVGSSIDIYDAAKLLLELAALMENKHA